MGIRAVCGWGVVVFVLLYMCLWFWDNDKRGLDYVHLALYCMNLQLNTVMSP